MKLNSLKHVFGHHKGLTRTYVHRKWDMDCKSVFKNMDSKGM